MRDWSGAALWIWIAWGPIGAATEDPMALRRQSKVAAHKVTVPCASVMTCAYMEKRCHHVLTTVDSIRNQGTGRVAPLVRCETRAIQGAFPRSVGHRGIGSK